jgi:hypothetical protein
MDVAQAVTPPAQLTSTTDSSADENHDVLQPTASFRKQFSARVWETSLAVIDLPT